MRTECPWRFRLWPLLLLAVACDSGTTEPRLRTEPVDLSLEWTTSTPRAEGFDAEALQQALADATGIERLRALVVVRNGRLVAEAYYDGVSASSVFDMRSVTKSVTALLVGMAVDDGLLAVDDGLDDWFAAERLRPEHEGITVEHLLTMTSGIGWSDEANFGPWVQSGEPVGYVLDLPVVAAPGQSFIYNSGGSHLLAVMVGLAEDRNTLEFADERLFGPLGITEGYWASFENGDPAGAAGLTLRARDLAKIGQLVLQEGRSGSRVLVSADWIRTQVGTRVSLGSVGGVLDRPGYGYQTWTDEADPAAIVMWGYGGQFVWLVPELDLVVVAAARWQNIGGYPVAGAQALEIAAFLEDRIVATAR